MGAAAWGRPMACMLGFLGVQGEAGKARTRSIPGPRKASRSDVPREEEDLALGIPRGFEDSRLGSWRRDEGRLGGKGSPERGELLWGSLMLY